MKNKPILIALFALLMAFIGWTGHKFLIHDKYIAEREKVSKNALKSLDSLQVANDSLLIDYLAYKDSMQYELESISNRAKVIYKTKYVSNAKHNQDSIFNAITHSDALKHIRRIIK